MRLMKVTHSSDGQISTLSSPAARLTQLTRVFPKPDMSGALFTGQALFSEPPAANDVEKPGLVQSASEGS